MERNNMTREEAINKVRQMSLPKETMDILEALAPELTMSEDERIRKALIHIVKGACDKYGIKYKEDEITEEKLLAYLEKQKEKSEKPIIPESEDERIRKGLIELIENWNYPQELFTTKRNIIAYLKKQKEQPQVADASKMEQEVDLEKEIDKGIADYSFTKTIDSGGFKTTVIDYAKIARHFYELGKARKEE